MDKLTEEQEELRRLLMDDEGDEISSEPSIISTPFGVMGPDPKAAEWALQPKNLRAGANKWSDDTICWLNCSWGEGESWSLMCDRVGWRSMEIRYRANDGEKAGHTWHTARHILEREFGFTRSEFHIRVGVDRVREGENGNYYCVWRPVIHKCIPWCREYGEEITWGEAKRRKLFISRPELFVGTASNPWPPQQSIDY